MKEMNEGAFYVTATSLFTYISTSINTMAQYINSVIQFLFFCRHVFFFSFVVSSFILLHFTLLDCFFVLFGGCFFAYIFFLL